MSKLEVTKDNLNVFVVCCITGNTCDWYGSKECAQEMAEALNEDCQNCGLHEVQEMHVFDAFVLEQFYHSAPREMESAGEFIERVYQQARSKIETAMRNGEIPRDWRLLDEIAEPLTDLRLVIHYVGGKAKRYTVKRKREDDVYDAFDRVMETLNSTGQILLWTEDARPTLVYRQGVAALELDQGNVMD